MTTIKNNTLQLKNIIKTSDNFYRFVNHDYKVLTTGFREKEGLIKNLDIMRFDKVTIDLMKKRYRELIKGV